MRILVLLTDGFGGHGGIAKFNRDLLTALCNHPDVQEVVAFPRIIAESPGPLPEKLTYAVEAANSKFQFAKVVLKSLIRRSRFDLIICGHINLLPLAEMARLFMPNQQLCDEPEKKLPMAPDRATSPNLTFASVLGTESEGLPSAATRTAPESKVDRRYRHRDSDVDPPSGSSARIARSQNRVPIALVIHGIEAWHPRSRAVRHGVPKIAALISVSEFTRKRFLSWSKLEGIASFILPNCVDLAAFSPGPKNPGLLASYGLAGRQVIMTLARLSSGERYKGIDEVLELLPGLAVEHPDFCYLICGDGDDRPRLMKKAMALGLAVSDFSCALSSPPRLYQGEVEVSNLRSRDPMVPQVVFTGRIPESGKADHFRLADAYVMPGWGEGFGIVYLEALACGLPVVGSKADASREVLRDGVLGMVVDPKNPDELRAAMVKAVAIRERKVPEALSDFSYESFERRCHDILWELTMGDGGTTGQPDHRTADVI